MKKEIYSILLILLSVSLYSCKEDDSISDEEYTPEREFSTMFRQDRNTGKGDSDPYRCQAVNRNDIQLYWYGVKGCAGYRLKMGLQTDMGAPADWDDPLKVLLDTIVGPDVTSLLIEDNQYSTDYRFAIQVLSTRGEAYHSKWHGHGDGRHWADYQGVTTEARYNIPEVLVVSDITKTGFRVNIDRNYATSGDRNGEFAEHFEIDGNGNFVMHTLTIAPSNTNPNARGGQVIQLTEADFQRGYVDVEGFDENCVYIVNVLNNKIKRYWDRLYNTGVIRMKGEPGEPVFIEHYCDPNDTIPGAVEYNACRIDTVLDNYNSDASLAEGTVFELEGGKTYYLAANVSLCKGLTLRTKAGTGRARVLMNGISETNNAPNVMNFMFGRNPLPGELGGINILALIFEDIDLDCPKAKNFGDGAATGNYFINMYSGGMAVSIESFEVRNCSFQRMVRGWIRVQGPNRKTFDKFLVEGCVFYNCGYYDTNGSGYNWVHGDDAHAKTNLYKNITFRNNTFYDSPRGSLILGRSTLLDWQDNIQWNITLENNTFVNFSTRSTGRYILNTQRVPGGSTITINNNLFVQTKKDGDERRMYLSGMDVRYIMGSGQVTYYIKDNYSTNTNLTNNQIFTQNAFNATSNAAGARPNDCYYGRDELIVKLGATGISPAELMADPNPPNPQGHKDMHERDNLDGLYFNNTDKVRNHEIYKLGIGDPRWAVNVTP